MIDFNCFVGAWPFYKVRRRSFEDLKNVHNENGISFGYISSLESVFYNDFYESEKELYNLIKGTEYKQVVTVNPTVDTCSASLSDCIRSFKVSGIRLVPGYHGYNISSPVTNAVMEIARENDLPVFISARLTDERLTHLLHPEALRMEDVLLFARNHPGTRIILNYVKDDETKMLCGESNVFYDTTGLSSEFLTGDPSDTLKRAVFGSGFPLRSLKSSLFLMNEVNDEKLRADVLSGAHIGL